MNELIVAIRVGKKKKGKYYQETENLALFLFSKIFLKELKFTSFSEMINLDAFRLVSIHSRVITTNFEMTKIFNQE